MISHILKILVAVVFAVFLYIVGCSDTHFVSLNNVSCDEFTGTLTGADCNVIGDKNSFFDNKTPVAQKKSYREFNYQVPLGLVDIIFIVDNSSSMHKEHVSLANQFSSFLRDVKYLDYRIAITTTDISSSPGNPNRNQSFQDGRFIRVGGRSFIENPRIGSNPSESLVKAFQEAIVRPETINCDKKDGGGYSDNYRSDFYAKYGRYPDKKVQAKASPCPSHDERAIFAANLAISNRNQASSFFRPDAHLMTVIISDEDERSGAKYIRDNPEYEFQDGDYPEVLVETVFRVLGQLKSFSVHSIIIPTTSAGCLNDQNRDRSSGQGSGRGFYGEQYERLSRARDKSLLKYGNLLRGSVISICSRSYGSQLSRLSKYAGDKIRVPLPCDKSRIRQIKGTVNGRLKRLNYEIEARTLIISPGEVSIDSRLDLNVICED